VHASSGISVREDLHEETGLPGARLTGDENATGRSISARALLDSLNRVELALATDVRGAHDA
jgi:hypothetical protein